MNELSLIELTACISDVIDLISIDLTDHHQKVACASYHLATEMGIHGRYRRDITLAAAMHDVGGLSLNDRLSAVKNVEDFNLHAKKGYLLLKNCKPLAPIASIIRYHHECWNHGKSHSNTESQIVFMADRIAASLDPSAYVLDQAVMIVNKIASMENTVFQPELVSALKRLTHKTSFWLDITSYPLKDFLFNNLDKEDSMLSGADLSEVIGIFSHIIDFRSRFTATHSKEVAFVAEALARLSGFSDQESDMMKTAGLLHDFGKLAVPAEILEKDGPLDAQERNCINSHPYYTDRILANLSGFETIRKWGALHHENPDGSGYPFNLTENELSTGSRIMKVADIFVALMEDRPYRKGMKVETALGILHTMAEENKVDRNILKLLETHIYHVDAVRRQALALATKAYNDFIQEA